MVLDPTGVMMCALVLIRSLLDTSRPYWKPAPLAPNLSEKACLDFSLSVCAPGMICTLDEHKMFVTLPSDERRMKPFSTDLTVGIE